MKILFRTAALALLACGVCAAGDQIALGGGKAGHRVSGSDTASEISRLSSLVNSLASRLERLDVHSARKTELQSEVTALRHVLDIHTGATQDLIDAITQGGDPAAVNAKIDKLRSLLSTPADRFIDKGIHAADVTTEAGAPRLASSTGRSGVLQSGLFGPGSFDGPEPAAPGSRYGSGWELNVSSAFIAQGTSGSPADFTNASASVSVTAETDIGRTGKVFLAFETGLGYGIDHDVPANTDHTSL